MAELPEATQRELLMALGVARVVEPVLELAYAESERNKWVNQIGDDPHGRPWHVSFHASQFPGDASQSCPRAAVYGLADIPAEGPPDRWLVGVADVGKAIELSHVRAARDAGYLVRSNIDGVSTDPESGLPQIGFIDKEHWLTGSVDMPLLPPNYVTPHIVEVKCLAGETEVITRQGQRRIEDLAGTEAEIINGQGNWQLVPFRQFGVDRLMKIELRSGKRAKVLYANAAHRWMVIEGKHRNGSPGRVEYTTDNLKPGMKLVRRSPRSCINRSLPSPIGIARGLVYGDGSLCISGGGSMLDLFGPKNFALLRYFPEAITNQLGNGGLRVKGFPASYKTERPEFNEGVSYLYGWLAGYFAADGTVAKNGSVFLDSVDRQSLEYVRDLCNSLGITTRPIYDIKPRDNTPPNNPSGSGGITIHDWKSYRLKIDAYTLTEDFFLVDEHRRRWDEAQERSTPSKRQDTWQVVSVTFTDRVEPVYCAVVEGSEEFVIEGYILTGNSKHEKKIAEMQIGERGPDEAHRRQLLCSLGLAAENPGAFMHPTEDVVLPAPVDGSILYTARDSEWPGPQPTHEFYFDYDPGFMEQGREHLKRHRQAFIEGELVETVPHKNTRSHPLGWKWSEGACKFCAAKKACKADYQNGINKLAESHTIAMARFSRPGYDYEERRRTVFNFWGEDDPLA